MPAAASERRAPSGWHRAGAIAFTVLAAALAAPSCTSVLALDRQQDAAAAICSLLDDCYAAGAPPGCADHVGGALEGASWGDVSTWFDTVNMGGCLTSCTAARLCLDQTPVCQPELGGACQAPTDCCFYTTGATQCEQGRCCATDGQHCTSDADCCTGACPDDPSDPAAFRCGGFVCRAKGDGCNLDDQCCSHQCVGHACAPTICNDDGFDCADDKACCSGYCAGGRCGHPPTCKLPLEPCTASDDCCPGDGPGGTHPSTCYKPDGASIGVCSPEGDCLPQSAHCASDKQCCTGFCEPNLFECALPCTDVGASCQRDVDCCSGHCDAGSCRSACSEAYCTTGADCCTGQCVLGSCVADCNTKTCGKVCDVGPPLDDETCGDTCITKICAADPFCCCYAWDALCVAAASAHCGTCP